MLVTLGLCWTGYDWYTVLDYNEELCLIPSAAWQIFGLRYKFAVQQIINNEFYSFYYAQFLADFPPIQSLKYI